MVRGTTAMVSRVFVATLVRPGDSCLAPRGWSGQQVLLDPSRVVRHFAGRAGRSEGEHSADQGPPGDGADDAVHGDRRDVLMEGLLEAADRGVGLGPEDAVHGEVAAPDPEQVLQGLDGMLPVALAGPAAMG